MAVPWTECKNFSLTEWYESCQLGRVKIHNGSPTHTYPYPPQLSWGSEGMAFWSLCKQKFINRSLWQSHPYLSCLLRLFQSTSPGLSHKPAILHCWCRDTLSSVTLFHVLLLSAYCTFQDLQVFLETFEANASLLERGTQDRDNSDSAAPSSSSSSASSNLAEQSAPACWSFPYCDRSPVGGPPPPPSKRISLRVGSGIDSSWARSLNRDM